MRWADITDITDISDITFATRAHTNEKKAHDEACQYKELYILKSYYTISYHIF